MNDINEALFCNRPSDFTQTKLMVHHHRRDDVNYIGSSGGSMTMGMVIAGGGSNHGEEQLKGVYIHKHRNVRNYQKASQRRLLREKYGEFWYVRTLHIILMGN